MNEQENKQDDIKDNGQNLITDLEPTGSVIGGVGVIGFKVIVDPQPSSLLSRESNLTYSGESGGLNE